MSGDVQGVGFRYFVLKRVQKITHIKGYVRNRRDGRVEVYAEGHEIQLVELEAALRQGPQYSSVSGVEVIPESPTGQHPDFRITF